MAAPPMASLLMKNRKKSSAAILLLNMKKDHFKIYFEEYPDRNYREVSSAIAKKAKTKFTTPAFLIGTSNSSADGEEILRGIEDVAGQQVNAYGGAAGDDYGFKDTFVFTNGKDSSNAMVCLALDETKVEIKGIATCGWKAVGTEKIVTKSEGNHVYTVDDIPVLDITAKYGGLENVTPENDNLLLEIAANFPLQLQRGKRRSFNASGPSGRLDRSFLLYKWLGTPGFQSTILPPSRF
ncbi:MAG: hypothetical protein IPL55_20375 [Saprospiraceae bacterium]|nr:hypothetical protein [Saprospiraceae bacterium]